MRLIGLCGRSGSGKSTFSLVARECGLFVIDCDAVYKELVSKPTDCLIEIGEKFGNEFIKDGFLNRKELARVVFSDKEKLNLLNNVTHKHIRLEIEKLLKKLPEDSIVILDAPTLFESGINKKCEFVIGIIASDEVCINRIVERDGLTEQQARLRLSNQPTNDFLEERCDVVISNNSLQEAFIEASNNVISNLKG